MSYLHENFKMPKIATNLPINTMNTSPYLNNINITMKFTKLSVLVALLGYSYAVTGSIKQRLSEVASTV